MKTYVVTGIDTDIGKTYVTGLIAHYLRTRGISVVTTKIVQTGCTGLSQDIITHRAMMGIDLSADDYAGTTCPYIFAYPASPHLAAKLEGKTVDIAHLDKAWATLSTRYTIMLLEGVGGVYVPLTQDYTLLDYIKERHYPVLVVTSCRLGSINHTLCTLDVLTTHAIPIQGLFYNHYPQEEVTIAQDTANLFARLFPDIPLVKVPFATENKTIKCDFDALEKVFTI